MKIYISHSRKFDFQKELYEPIRQSSLNNEHTFILPHEKSDEPFSSKEFFEKECDLVIAEVSFPSTGQGIELGWANIFEVPILCVHKKDSKIANSLKVVSDKNLEYSSSKGLIEIIKINIPPCLRQVN